MNHRKLRDGIIIAVCAVAVVITAVLYAIFASNHIFKEVKRWCLAFIICFLYLLV